MIDSPIDASTRYTVFVSAQETGERVDKFLASHMMMSRGRIQSLLEGGHVLLNDKPFSNASAKTKAGDTFIVDVPPLEEPQPKGENIPLDVIYEDADVIVINKPAGMVVHPAPGTPSGTLVNALLYHCGESLSGINGVKRPGIVHRIDKETSGLLVAAKNDEAHQGLAYQFAHKTISRHYVAVVWGLTPPEGIITGNIGRHSRDRKKMALLQDSGKPAETHFTQLEGFKRIASLVECRLKTGRTHQIRVHMTHLGHPLVGDAVYGKAPRDIPLALKEFLNTWSPGRQALHARSLGFKHPTTGEFLSFEVPLPKDMLELINVLESCRS